VGRFFIEALRLDSFWVGSLRVPQLASVAGVLVAAAGLLWVLRGAPAEPALPVPESRGKAPATRGRRPRG
jgi:prolipoprotein diacylglyceryltransferase